MIYVATAQLASFAVANFLGAPACHVVVLEGDGRPAVAGRTRLSENPHSADVTLSCRAVASAKAETIQRFHVPPGIVTNC